MRPVLGNTEAEYQQLLVNLQQEIGQANKIVIVGAGAVGVELSGVRMIPLSD